MNLLKNDVVKFPGTRATVNTPTITLICSVMWQHTIYLQINSQKHSVRNSVIQFRLKENYRIAHKQNKKRESITKMRLSASAR